MYMCLLVFIRYVTYINDHVSVFLFKKQDVICKVFLLKIKTPWIW
jgi:hypothetical protein